ncbi:hypothetical protein BGY98DRAFT_953912 [Russula aff. rugulosa BPL654]|nr:hypothetical protein BGY98DRAFT_953912 [Russula aff. rugulosa BPL654]
MDLGRLFGRCLSFFKSCISLFSLTIPLLQEAAISYTTCTMPKSSKAASGKNSAGKNTQKYEFDKVIEVIILAGDRLPVVCQR